MNAKYTQWGCMGMHEIVTINPTTYLAGIERTL